MSEFPPNYVKVFSAEECDEIIKYAESLNKWTKFSLLNEKNYYRCDIEMGLDWVNSKFIDYLKTYADIEITHPEFLTCFKYETGGFFVKHRDFVPERDFYKDLMFNVNTVLNENFEGGKFILNDKEIPPNRGYVYYYNSDILHEVTEITAGTRYTLMFGVFTHNIKRKDLI